MEIHGDDFAHALLDVLRREEICVATKVGLDLTVVLLKYEYFVEY